MDLLTALYVSLAVTSSVKVVVIDTGFRANPEIKWCDGDHRDYTNTGLYDNDGHGTNVSGLIAKHAGVPYCITAVKFYDPKSSNPTITSLNDSIEYAISLNPDIINISGGGVTSSYREKVLIKKALDRGITVVVAAGNNSSDLDKECNYFPACHDERIIVVGCALCGIRNQDKIIRSSNHGKVVDVVEDGYRQSVLGIELSGSSQATAIHTGKIIKDIYKRKNESVKQASF